MLMKIHIFKKQFMFNIKTEQWLELLTFLSELGPRVVCVSLSIALCLSWAAGPSDQDLQQTQTFKQMNQADQSYFKLTRWLKMNVLTTGGSLLSVLPSDILLSEPQEVGEYSLCWTERQQTVLIWSLPKTGTCSVNPCIPDLNYKK